MRTLLLMLATIAAGVAPGPAGAAVTIEVVPSPLTPYTSGGFYTFDKEYYVARGTADPKATVTVTITDALGSPPVTATATADNVGEWFVSPNVTNLGLHETTPSTLTFTATADNGTDTSTATVTATKVAATPHDGAAPLLIVMKRFSGDWCREYSCSDGSVWKTLADKGVVLTGRTSPCRTSSGNATFDSVWRPITGDSTSCSADKFLAGTAEDYTESSQGFASEIADVEVTVVRKRDGQVIKTYHPLVRRGTFASWGVVLKIADYEDNEEYEWKVKATDAWGRSSEESDSFKVTP